MLLLLITHFFNYFYNLPTAFFENIQYYNVDILTKIDNILLYYIRAPPASERHAGDTILLAVKYLYNPNIYKPTRVYFYRISSNLFSPEEVL